MASPGRGARDARIQSTDVGAGSRPITGSVLAVYEDGKPGVRALVFHQLDRAEGPRPGGLLVAHSGEEMEIDTSGGQRHGGTVCRLKSRLGRRMVGV